MMASGKKPGKLVSGLASASWSLEGHRFRPYMSRKRTSGPEGHDDDNVYAGDKSPAYPVSCWPRASGERDRESRCP
jgi:hypothetical protein